MSDERRQILDLLAENKISAEEADRLLAALESNKSESTNFDTKASKRKPRYVRILVDTADSTAGSTKVNVRVPIQLLRAGVKLTSLVPAQARGHMNEAMREQGINFDINQIKPENLDELIDQLNDLTVDVDQPDTKVKIFCE